MYTGHIHDSVTYVMGRYTYVLSDRKVNRNESNVSSCMEQNKNMYVVVSELASTVNGKAMKAGVLGAVLAVTAFVGPVHAALNEAGTGGDSNVAFGEASSAQGANSVAIGNNASAEGANTVAQGVGALAKEANSVAIGANASTTGENAVAIGTGSKSGSAGNSGQSTVAIGGSAQATSNRAIAIGDSAKSSWYDIAIGARVEANPTSVAIGGGYNAAEAARTTMPHSVALGTYAKTTAAVDTAEATVTANGTSLKFTGFAGDGKANGEGFVVSIGTSGKEKQVQNVAAGQITATSTDAVNGSQLHAVAGTMSTIAGSVKTILGGNAAVADTGAITMTNIGGTGKDTVEEAIKVAKTEVVEGKNVTVTPSTGANGQSVYTVAVKDDITLNSVTTGTTKVDANGVTIGGKNYVSSNGLNANNQAIKNVGDGSVAAGSKDAVNGGQLHSELEKKADKSELNTVKQDVNTVKDTVGKNTAEISNIKKDVSKVKQDMNTVKNDVSTMKDSIEETINEKIKEINANTSNTSQNMNVLENRVNSRMDKAVAGSAALAALHPLDFDENDKWNVAAGYGSYGSGNALALGAFYRPNEDTMFSIGGAMGNGQNMVNVGVSLKLGQHNGVSKSRKAMAQEIDDLKAQLQEQDQKIAMLMNAMANMQQAGK